MKDNSIDKQRWKVIRIALIVIGIYLFTGLLFLQVVQGRLNAEKASINSVRRLPIPATRGVMYDRNGEVLVNSVSGYVITMSYMSEEENLETINKLAPILIDQKITESFNKLFSDEEIVENRAELFEQYKMENYHTILQELKAEITEAVEEQKYYRRYQPIKIAPLSGKTINNVTLEIVAAIEGMRSQLPSVFVEVQPQRQYKIGNYGFHILGGIKSIDRVGREGLEKSYDNYLSGQDGMSLVEVNVYGRPTNQLGVVPPVQGDNLILSLDKDLQIIAEQALLDSMQATRDKLINEAKRKGKPEPSEIELPYSGAVVVMDVNSGALLASASLPQVDRNNYADVWKTSDPFIKRFKPGTNWVTGTSRPPGSIVKPIIGIAALESNLINEEAEIYCGGTYRGLYNSWSQRLYCWDRSGHGSHIEITAALKNSCNLFFYPLGERLGLDLMSEYFIKFGLGQKVHFPDMIYSQENQEGEITSGYATTMSEGIVVNSAEFRELYRRGPYSSELAQASIGQGDLRVNPLQIALYTSMIANAELQPDGTYKAIRWQPYVVERVVKESGEVEFIQSKTVADEITFEKMALDSIREGMRKVVEEKGGPDGNTGTAFWPFHEYDYKAGYKSVFPFEIAGKTGTAQETGWNNHGWFISYAPYDNPEIAVVVLMDQGMSGGSTGAPVARAVYEHYFKDIIDDYNNVSVE